MYNLYRTLQFNDSTISMPQIWILNSDELNLYSEYIVGIADV